MKDAPGPFSGTCIVCLKPTDTAVAFLGPPEMAMGALMAMGVPEDQAVATIEAGMEPLDYVLRSPIALRVCATCATRAHLSVGPADGDVPLYDAGEGRS